MKRIFAVLLLLTVSAFASTACGVLRLDTSEVKVIEKPKSGDTSAQDKGKTPDQNTGSKNSDLDEKGKVLQEDTEEYIRSIIGDRAAEVMAAIKNYDMQKLSGAVHPVKGVRFSPYGYVHPTSDLVFGADELKNLGSDPKKYVWGSFDGSGEPIELTFAEYYKGFIYDVDFVNAEQIGYNKILGKGSAQNNSFEIYKNPIIVEYHFPGFDPQLEGFDWKSLRLVFEKMNDTWYLVGIIHDQWTI